jgi:alpha-mannosidase
MLHVSLVRSPKVTPTRGDADTTTFGSNKSMEVSDLGQHHVRLAIGHFDAGAAREMNPAALAETLFREPITYTGTAVSSPLLGLDGDQSLIPTWVKPMADGSMLLRLNETLGQRGSVKIKLADGYKAVMTDLRGEAAGQPVTDLTVEYKPYMLTTVRIGK